MYYNKLEALREKEAAEKMIISNDYVSARDKLLKARQLFPGLDHIVAMLTVCDILSASKNKIPGYDTDHYWVLHLVPSSSFSDISCRYQKLLNLLLPLKNKFPGTESALKLIEDAFSVLSDPDMRIAFDLKRKTSWEGYESLNVQATSIHSLPRSEMVVSPKISSVCGRVSSGEVSNRMLSEKGRDFVPEPLANQQCADISLEVHTPCSSHVNSDVNIREELDVPENDVNLPQEHSSSPKQTPSLSSNVVAQRRLSQDFCNFMDNRKFELFKTGQIWAAHYQLGEPQSYRYARVDAILKAAVRITWLKPVPISDVERRWCDAGLPVACGAFWLDSEKGQQVVSPTAFSYNCSWARGVTEEQYEIYPKKGEIWALYEDWDLEEWSYNPENAQRNKFKLVEVVSDFSKYMGANCACLVKTDGVKSIFQRLSKDGNPLILEISPNNLYMFSHKVPSYRFTGGEMEGVIEGMFELDQFALPNNMIRNMDDPNSSNLSTVENSDSSNFTSSPEQHPFLKPYPESKILEPDWSPGDFTAGQVWAVFSGKDWMPRQYTRINNVCSGNQVCVTFLEHQTILDHEITWKKESLPVVCGVYAATGANVKLQASQFSHVAKCERSMTKSIYRIYPMKNEIWAMYKNWNKKWKLSDYENSRFDVVEILSDLSGGSGITIARLIEVEGCLTFFQRQQCDGFDLTREISKSEALSFSHRIPAFRVLGIGRYGIPESSWHLEPNSLPASAALNRASSKSL